MDNRLFVVCLLALALPTCRCEPQRATEPVPEVARKRDKIRKPQQKKFLSAATILIAYQGAAGASSAKRTKDEARKLADDLAARLKQNPASFTDLARKHSSGATAYVGGDLGAWRRGKMPQEIEKVVDSLAIGQVSPVLDTPQGFQILRRQIAVLSASQIVVAVGTTHSGKTRSRAEAQKLVEELYGKLRTNPTLFSILAQQHSDASNARAGGRLGVWLRGQKASVERVIDRLEIEEVSRPAPHGTGYWLLRREDPYPKKP